VRSRGEKEKEEEEKKEMNVETVLPLCTLMEL